MIPLSFKNAYATQLSNNFNFTIDFSMRPKDADKRTPPLSSWLLLKANSKIELIGSKMKVTGLVSKVRPLCICENLVIIKLATDTE